MKKSKAKKTKSKKTSGINPEQAAEFLENFRLLQSGIDKPTRAISLRVPDNILEAFKTLAKSEKRAYQSMMIEALRDYLVRYRS